MRIISGIRRGAVLYCLDGSSIRPTADKVKEAVFSMIAEYLPGASVLDLFAGSGALSFEALSRGAENAVLTDSDKKSVAVIEKNRAKLGFEYCAKIINTDAFSYLRSHNEAFDIIFLDPPYNKGLIEPVLTLIEKRQALKSGGIIVLESDDTDFCGAFGDFSLLRQKRYGRTHITIYKKKDEKANANSGISGEL